MRDVTYSLVVLCVVEKVCAVIGLFSVFKGRGCEALPVSFIGSKFRLILVEELYV